MKYYYTEEEVFDMVEDMEALNEYLYGLNDAIVDGKYKKKYVDQFCNR